MYIDIAIVIISLCLTIGFYTKNLDWLIIWYGCAPVKKKESMPGDMIMSVAYYSMLIISVLMCLSIFMRCLRLEMISYIIRILSALIFVSMLVATFYLAQIKGNNILRKIGNKAKKNSLNTVDIKNTTDIKSSSTGIPENTNKSVETEHKEYKSTHKKKNKSNKENKSNYKSKNQRIKEALNQRK